MKVSFVVVMSKPKVLQNHKYAITQTITYQTVVKMYKKSMKRI